MNRRSNRASWAMGLLAGLLLANLSHAGSSSTAFPKPRALEPDVAFWVRVYSKLGNHQGVIHDARSLNIVYETLDRLPPEFSDERGRLIETHLQSLRERLLYLSTSSGRPRDPQDEWLLLTLKGHTRPQDLRAAAENVRFQSGQADRFREGLIRASLYRPRIEAMLRAAQLPVELAALPHVESSFDPNALSKVGAAGLWQLTRSTGRLYLRIDGLVDERLDPFAATGAAIGYFQEAHARLGSWPLALVSYNHGVNGMARAQRTLGTSDIVQVLRQYQSPSFKFASRNFYPSFLAALEVERNAKMLFPDLLENASIAPAHETPPTALRTVPTRKTIDFLARVDGRGSFCTGIARKGRKRSHSQSEFVGRADQGQSWRCAGHWARIPSSKLDFPS